MVLNIDESDDGDDESRHELLHHLITDEILIRLPVKSLLRFKSVSKEWKSTISSHNFSWSHLERYMMTSGGISAQCILVSFHPNNEYPTQFVENYGAREEERGDRVYIWGSADALNVEPDNVRAMYCHMVGSCNGLICFADRDYCCFRIWNPCTDECHAVKDCPLTGYDHANMQICTGFGYVWSEDNYKIVVVALRKYSDNLVFVYSLRANEWKQISGSSEHQPNVSGIKGRGVLVNERLYWEEDTSDHLVSEDVYINVLNLEDEEFETVFPSELLEYTSYLARNFQLCAIIGFLGIHSTIRPDLVWIRMESEWFDYYVFNEYGHPRNVFHEDDQPQNLWLLLVEWNEDGDLDWMYYKFDKEVYQDAMFYVETLESPLLVMKEECRL